VNSKESIGEEKEKSSLLQVEEVNSIILEKSKDLKNTSPSAFVGDEERMMFINFLLIFINC
jgi:hypothetical protein